jgi:hypothetical protein
MPKPFSGKCLSIASASVVLMCVFFLHAEWVETSAEAAGFEVSLEFFNAAGPYGGKTYEIDTLIFARNGVPLATQTIDPPEEIRPQDSGVLGPFLLAMKPDEVTLLGMWEASYIGSQKLCATLSPIDWDEQVQLEGESLQLTPRFTELMPVPTLTQWGAIGLCALVLLSGLLAIRAGKEGARR